MIAPAICPKCGCKVFYIDQVIKQDEYTMWTEELRIICCRCGTECKATVTKIKQPHFEFDSPIPPKMEGEG